MSKTPSKSHEGEQDATRHDANDFLGRLEAEMKALFFRPEVMAEVPHKESERPQSDVLVPLIEKSQDIQKNLVENESSEPSPVVHLLDLSRLVYGMWVQVTDRGPLTTDEGLELLMSLVKDLRELPQFAGIPGIARHFEYCLSATSTFLESTNAAKLPDLSQCNRFQYKPLKDASSIRLVRFGDVAGHHRTIELLLEEVALDAAPAFNALSYVWGDHRAPLNQRYHQGRAERRIPILCNGARIEVSHNLYCFLRRISSATDAPLQRIRDSPVWIDQLCINQEDIAEKNSQVALMDRIYSQAEEVVSWLGEKDGQSDAAIQLVEMLGSRPTSDGTPGPAAAAGLVRATPGDEWQALAGLLARPYFTRAWIVQEVALARRQLVLCGDRAIDWEDLVKTSDLLEGSRAWAMLSRHVEVFQPDEGRAMSHSARPSTRFGGHLAALLRAQRTIRGGESSAERLLLLGRQFDATVAVDRFFAMLGIARRSISAGGQEGEGKEEEGEEEEEEDQMRDLPRADYSRSLKDVAVASARYHMRRSKSFGLLAMREDLVHRTGQAEGFPSWLPDPSAPLLPLPLAADALGLDRNTSFRCWGAVPPPAPGIVTFEGEQLVLQGRNIDIVGLVAEPFHDVARHDAWYQIFDFVSHVVTRFDLELSGLKLGEALWRTLLASPEMPRGGDTLAADDLGQEFGDWCISLLDALRNPDRHLLDHANRYILAKMYSLDDLTFDAQVFGPDAEVTTVNGPPRAFEEIPELLDSIAEADKQIEDENRRARLEGLADKLHDALCLLWKLNPDDVFPSPQRIADTLRTLETTKDGPDELHRHGGEIRNGIDRFQAAVGMKMDSRRLFTTARHCLGMGPQSLALGDEIWLVHGADAPLILRRVKDRETFRLVGEAYVFGIMHGEAVQGPRKSLSIDVEVRLE